MVGLEVTRGADTSLGAEVRELLAKAVKTALTQSQTQVLRPSFRTEV